MCIRDRKKGSARGSVQGRCDYTTVLDIEVVLVQEIRGVADQIHLH